MLYPLSYEGGDVRVYLRGYDGTVSIERALHFPDRETSCRRVQQGAMAPLRP